MVSGLIITQEDGDGFSAVEVLRCPRGEYMTE
jgi:hypothetical protein